MLLSALKDEAICRDLWSRNGEHELDVQEVFELVRDMPYQRASNREPRTTISEWRGTCSGKHYLLKHLFAELGLTSTLMACTHYIAVDLAVALPNPAGSVLMEGPVPDVHNYLILDSGLGAMIVDATWPRGSELLGLQVNESFAYGRDMQLPCVPIEHFKVPEERDPQEFKEELLTTYFPATEVERRERFFQLIAG